MKADQPDANDDFPNTAASFTYIPSANYRPAPKFHAPPPPPVYSDFDQAEIDFLAELDAQIAELQVIIITESAYLISLFKYIIYKFKFTVIFFFIFVL